MPVSLDNLSYLLHYTNIPPPHHFLESNSHALHSLHHLPIPLLPHHLPPILSILFKILFHEPYGDLIPPLAQLRPRIIHKLRQRNPKAPPILNIRLMPLIMQLRLHRGRKHLNNINRPRRCLRRRQLVPQHENQLMQSSLRRAVIRRAQHRGERQSRRRIHERRRSATLLLQERDERDRQPHEARVVGVELRLEQVEVDGGRVGEVEGPLHAGVEEDAVQVRVGGGDGRDEGGDSVVVRDVEDEGGGVVGAAVLGDEGVEVLFAPAGDDDFDVVLDEALCHGGADAGRGADDEDFLVGEARHFW